MLLQWWHVPLQIAMSVGGNTKVCYHHRRPNWHNIHCTTCYIISYYMSICCRAVYYDDERTCLKWKMISPPFRAITALPALIVVLDDSQLWAAIVKLTTVGCPWNWYRFEINGGWFRGNHRNYGTVAITLFALELLTRW